MAQKVLPQLYFHLRKALLSVRGLAALLLGVLLVSAAVCYPLPWEGTLAGQAEQPYFLAAEEAVNINTAPPEELALLPGIGPGLAQAIVAYREENGPFASLEDVGAVPGIGPRTLQGLEGKIAF